MMCATRERLERVTASLVGALEPGGGLLTVITHPCFRNRDFGTFHYELPEGYDYWRSGAAYEVVLTPPAADEDVVITDYHWTVTDYVTAFVRAGGVVAGLRELPGRRPAPAELRDRRPISPCWSPGSPGADRAADEGPGSRPRGRQGSQAGVPSRATRSRSPSPSSDDRGSRSSCMSWCSALSWRSRPIAAAARTRPPRT
jgi:hypothetical protein